MRLDDMLDRCQRLEERAGALYRSFAASSRAEPQVCALWTALAREEEEHAQSIAAARLHREATTGWRTRLDGWAEALGEVDARLTEAERLGGDATTAQQLATALELEMTELDGMRHVLVELCGRPVVEGPNGHAARLADAAIRLSPDDDVRMEALLLRARARLRLRGGAKSTDSGA